MTARRHELPRDTALPLYRQIYLALRDDILAGRKAQGESMPTELALAETFGVSRVTARHALTALAEDGLVARRRRTGTHVTFKASAVPIESDMEKALGSLIAFGRGTEVRVVEVGEIVPPADIAARFALQPGEAALRALRIRLSGGRPMGAIESYVPRSLSRLVTRERLASTPILELVQQGGQRIGGGQQIISAVSADPDLAAMLDTEPRAPLLRIERLVTDEAGRPLLLTIAQYRGDSYRLSLDFDGAG
jgi:GntR family transcriptional regulator